MKEKVCDEWSVLRIFYANLLSILAAAATTTTTFAAAAAAAAAVGDALDDQIVCPAIADNHCSCYVFDNNAFLECPGVTMSALRHVLVNFVHVPIQTLSIYDLDQSVTTIGGDDFAKSLVIRQLHISLSNIDRLNDDSFRNIAEHLESLAVVSGRLKSIPQKTLPYLTALRVVNLEANKIGELPDYGFYGLRLVAVNLKANALRMVREYAFAGLEDTLEEADLSANQLERFPMTSIRRLRHLATLKMAWNKLDSIPDDGYTRLECLHHLDLSSNRFASVTEDAFRALPQLRTLSLHYNAIEGVHQAAFASLSQLDSLDLSHNRIVYLDPRTFRSNLQLRTIDISHNHVHAIGGLFAYLPRLKEVFAGENNVLEVPNDAFANATALDAIYLQRNAIRRVEADAFIASGTLHQLHLGDNFIETLWPGTLSACSDAVTLNLDGNAVAHLLPGTFDNATRLRELRLRDNQLSLVHATVFAPLRHLVELHLRHNTIETIEAGAFRTMRALQYVDLRGNRLRMLGDVFWRRVDGSSSSLWSPPLISIQLDDNELVEVHDDVFRGQTNVQTVQLARNRLGYLSSALLGDLSLVRSVHLADNAIAVVEDGAFHSMRALLVLDLSGNALRAIGATTFAQLDAVEELYLSSNRIHAIEPGSFAHLVKLRVLDLAHNPLATLSTYIFGGGGANSPLLPLQRLRLENCSLTTAEWGALDRLRELRELDVRDNWLADAFLIQLESDSIHMLDASKNNISWLSNDSLAGLPQLTRLLLDENRLTRFEAGTFAHNSQLMVLSVRDNRLHALPATLFDETADLRELVLDGNQLLAIPYTSVAGAVSLRKLSVAGNHIVDVDFWMLRTLHNLTELNASSNAIGTLTGFVGSNFTRLTRVDLANNSLATLTNDFFHGAVALRVLDLSSNRFERVPLPAIVGGNLPALECLVFDGNPIRQLYASSLASSSKRSLIHELRVANTNMTVIASVDLDAFTGGSLLHLYLAHNTISRIAPDAFHHLADLQTLDLGHNRITLLPQRRLRGLFRLRWLNLTANMLRELDPFSTDLSALETLDLSHNRIVAIDRHPFQYLHNLTELRLNGNRIFTILADAFRPLEQLRMLDIAQNRFRAIPLNALRSLETHIRWLGITENPLSCECNQQEAWEWLRDHEKVLIEGGYVNELTSLLQCEQPSHLYGRPFLQLDPSMFCATAFIFQFVIQDIQPFSVNVSWQIRNYSEVYAYKITYNSISPTSAEFDATNSSTKLFNGETRSVQLVELIPNTRYSICVFGLTSSSPSSTGLIEAADVNFSINASVDEVNTISTIGHRSNDHAFPLSSSLLPSLGNEWSRCTEVRTLRAGDDYRTHGPHKSSLLTRRLGLIIGSCMGCVVFVVLVLILVYMKMKKQRDTAKNHQPLPPEYLSYRHFSLPGCDPLSTRARGAASLNL